jgi:hypothetical protein
MNILLSLIAVNSVYSELQLTRLTLAYGTWYFGHTAMAIRYLLPHSPMGQNGINISNPFSRLPIIIQKINV